MRRTLAVVLLATLMLAGCGQYEPAKPQGRSAAPEAVGVAVDPFSMAEPVKSSTQGEAAQAPVPGSSAPGPSGAVPQSPPVQPQPMSDSREPLPEGTVREQATVGAGQKGHYSPGIITTPLSVYFRAQERITFNIEIPHAMKLYKATNGRYPKDMEEFTRAILQPARIQLPELPQGHRYVYDAEKGELLVEHPG